MINPLNFQQFYSVFAPASPMMTMAHNKGVSTTAAPANMSFLTALSYDSVLAILSFLSVQDLGRLAQVSREAHAFAEDDSVWRGLCKALTPRWCEALSRPAQMVPKIYARPGEWKRVYHIEIQRIALCSKFVGLWSEKWCDVNVQQSTSIESDGRSWSVAYKKNKFAATFRDFDPYTEVLTFHLEGGDSGWSFIYKIKPITEHHCQLTVYRMHDQKTFTGDFFRITADNSQPRLDNAMGTHI